METQTLRTSTILIAAEGKTRIYKSRSEMPPVMRQRMQRALNSGSAATILIADQRGRDEILKLLRGEPSALKSAPGSVRRRIRVEAAAPQQKEMRVTIPAWMQNRWVRAALAFLLPAGVGAAFYALMRAGQ